jgi:hypothetical protein
MQKECREKTFSLCVPCTEMRQNPRQSRGFHCGAGARAYSYAQVAKRAQTSGQSGLEARAPFCLRLRRAVSFRGTTIRVLGDFLLMRCHV